MLLKQIKQRLTVNSFCSFALLTCLSSCLESRSKYCFNSYSIQYL